MGSTSVYRDVRGISTFDLVADELRDDFRDRVVAHATASEQHDCGSSVFWAAVRDRENPDEVFALCVLYKRVTESKYGYGTGEFWYKVMDETVGPCYYDVPNKVWNALTPLPADEPADSYRAGWRANVEARRAALAARPKVKPGDVVEFPGVTYRGYEDVIGFEYVEKSIFRPVYVDGTLYSRVRLRGWTKQHYRLVEKETVDA